MSFPERLAQERAKWNAGKWLASLPFLPLWFVGWIAGLLVRLLLGILANLRAATAIGYNAGRGRPWSG